MAPRNSQPAWTRKIRLLHSLRDLQKEKLYHITITSWKRLEGGGLIPP